MELTGSDRALREKRRIEENEQVFASAQGRLGKTKTLGLYHDFRRSWDDVMYLPKVSGRMRVFRQTPLDLLLDQLESSGWIFVLLTEDLAGIVTGSGLIKDEDTKGVLPAGSRVDTYLLHFDPLGEAKIQIPVAGTIRFARPILGVICTDATIVDSGVLLGAPGVRYTEDKFGQGIESDMKAFSDRVIIHEDRKSLSMALSITGGVMDQIRILVEAVPSP